MKSTNIEYNIDCLRILDKAVKECKNTELFEMVNLKVNGKKEPPEKVRKFFENSLKHSIIYLEELKGILFRQENNPRSESS